MCCARTFALLCTAYGGAPISTQSEYIVFELLLTSQTLLFDCGTVDMVVLDDAAACYRCPGVSLGSFGELIGFF